MWPPLSRPSQSPESKPKAQIPLTLATDRDVMEQEPLPEPLLREPKQPQPLPALSWGNESESPSDSF